MRLWLNDADRLPDPVPVRTDDRKPVLFGLVAWVIALVAVLAFGEPLGDSWAAWLWSCVAGVVLGLLGLAYTQRRHSRGH